MAENNQKKPIAMSHLKRPLKSLKSGPLSGTVQIPGDKSLSHRALIFGALATGMTEVTGLLQSDDVMATANALRQMGISINKTENGTWQIIGRGIGGLTRPVDALDFGNTGTGVRLMMGVLAGHNFDVRLTGDQSLSSRPMGRVLAPLRQMGINTNPDKSAHDEEGQQANNKDHLPLTFRGSDNLIPINYTLPVPSAQVKSAILLAGLHALGKTTVIEPVATRDHTERMLNFFGAELTTKHSPEGKHITITGQKGLTGTNLSIPADPSSAAFLTAAALITPGSDILIERVLTNPTRTGFFKSIQDMDGKIQFENIREEAGEEVADLRVRASKLKGATIPARRAPSMIDEYPCLAAVAAYAEGVTIMKGLAELKVKESDRLEATRAGLEACGVSAEIEGDTLAVVGKETVPGGGEVKTHLDHRIAMSFLTLGLASDQAVTVDDGTMIATSFPDFVPLMTKIGAKIENIPNGANENKDT